MYSSKIMVERIKSLSKEKGIALKDVLKDNGLGVNALNQVSDKKGISSLALADIADYLDVSVDYLLGRTNNPESHKSSTNNDLILQIDNLKKDIANLENLYKK